ncbi:tetratricopeptide repeat-containing protein [Mycolicibacterium sp. Dal123E01]|uniref:tetratricopeptide repeat-containing protein n=1 Tax=Mycolicibacterium sp. Dal123E01 TaxID=3457578 RepID=UPI00403EB2EE
MVDQSNPQQAIALAHSYFEARAYRRAHEVLSEALVHNPNDPALLRELARAEICLEHWVPGAVHAHAALARSPQDTVAMRMYALALDGLGRRAEAIWMAWRTVTAAPNEYLAHYTYALLLYRAGYSQQALTVIDEALHLQPNDPDTWALKGGILRALHRSAESDAAYQQALRIQPDHATSINDMAINRLRQGSLSAALRGFLGAASIDPTLGKLTRTNVAATLTSALRRVTWAAIIVGIVLVSTAANTKNHEPVALPRVVAAIGCLALLGYLVAVIRSVSARMWRSALGLKGFLAIRVIHAACAVIATAGVAIWPKPGDAPLVAGMAIALSGVLISRLGGLAKM